MKKPEFPALEILNDEFFCTSYGDVIRFSDISCVNVVQETLLLRFSSTLVYIPREDGEKLRDGWIRSTLNRLNLPVEGPSEKAEEQ